MTRTRSETDRAARWWLAVLVAPVAGLLLGAGCTSEKSHAVVTVRAAQGEFMDVTELRVQVWNGAERQDLLYFPPRDGRNFSFSADKTIDFSLSFSTSLSGTLRVGVQPLDVSKRQLGYGESESPIDPGHVIRMVVSVVPGLLPNDRDGGPPGDGGPGDGSSERPPQAMCDPGDVTGCSGNRTCYVGCFREVGAGLCTAAGAGKPGDTCTVNADCEPGSQCLGFGCGRMCVRLCRGEADCGSGACRREIPCEGRSTGYRFCTQACDPRGATSGCPAPLACLLFSGDMVTCDCPGNSRTGAEDAPCDGLTACRPGLICVTPSGGGGAVCRPICKRSDNDCPAGRTCAELRNPDFTDWGACL